MKSLRTFLTIFILFIGLSSFSQSFEATTYIEQTHIGPKLGTAIGYTFKSDMELGGFYQNAAGTNVRSESSYQTYEKEFYGMYVNYPLTGNDKIDLKFNIRTGVTNGQNFLITPSLLTNFKPSKFISFGAGVGVRCFRPTLQACLKINI